MKLQVFFQVPEEDSRIRKNLTEAIKKGHKKQTRFFRIIKAKNTAVTKPDVILG